jgi:hypothetical protein
MKNLEKKVQECRENIMNFVAELQNKMPNSKDRVVFVDNGTVGFGTPAIGIWVNGKISIDYNPTDENEEYISRFYDERLQVIVPESAYENHNGLIVVVKDNDIDFAIMELSGWVDRLRKVRINEVAPYVKEASINPQGYYLSV